jgi:integrase/recombinase XerD
MDIHNYEKKYQQCRRRIEKAKISKRNKELILEMNDALVLDGISKPRLAKYMEVLKLLAQKLNKDFDKAKVADLKKVVSEIQQSNYSPWTKQTYKVILRRFYKWLHGGKDYPEIVSWINIRMSRSEKRLPSEGDLLKEKDIIKLLSTAKHPRDKALIAMLWESGGRIGELGNLSQKNVSFDQHGVLLSVRGKTGSRKVRLIWSVPYLSTWIANHPSRDDPDSPVWISVGNVNHKKPMTYQAIRMLLQRTGKEAGIKKRVNPHSFRHSRATFMAHHLTEFQMNQYFGWIQGSDMPSTYVHMSGRDVDNAILAMNGIVDKEKGEKQQLLPIKCPRCETINGQENRFCLKCGGIIDIKYAMEIQETQEREKKERVGADSLMNLLLKDKEVLSVLQEKLQGLEISNFSF